MTSTTFDNVKKYLKLPHRFEAEDNGYTGVTINIIVTNNTDDLLIFSNSVSCGSIVRICKDARIDIEHYLAPGEEGVEFSGNNSDVKEILLDNADEVINFIDELWNVEFLED